MPLSRSLRRSFTWASCLAGALAVSVASAVACSSTSAAPPTENACTGLAACCVSLHDPATANLCASMVAAGNQSGSDTTCAATLQSYTQSGLCGAVSDAGAGSLPGYDATAPCALTGTCVTSSFDGGGLPTEDANVATSTEDSAAPKTEDAALPPPPSEDAGPDCGTPPALHPETQPGVYCPFTAAGAIHCPASEQCCEAPSDAGGAASTCQLLGATCPFAGSLTWECDGPVDCASSGAGTVCCGNGAVNTDAVCGFDRGSGFSGTHCATSCATGEVTICAAATDPCPTGTTCTPFKSAGVVLGTCL